MESQTPPTKSIQNVLEALEAKQVIEANNQSIKALDEQIEIEKTKPGLKNFLRRLFGNEIDKLKTKGHGLIDTNENINQAIQQFLKNNSDNNSRMIKGYTEQLEGSDPDYLKKKSELTRLLEHQKSLASPLQDLVSAISNARNSCDKTRQAISSAKSDETLDMFTSNKGIAIMSSLSTSNAKSKVSDLKNEINRLEDYSKRKLNTYKEQLGSQADIKSALSHLDLTGIVDFVIDIAFDSSFDFSSFLNYSALSSSETSVRNADSNLGTLREKVQTMLRPIEKNIDKVRQELSSIKQPKIWEAEKLAKADPKWFSQDPTVFVVETPKRKNIGI